MTVIGIDIGGSTTKIVGIRDGVMMKPLQVRATDALTSVYGAFGRYMSENGVSLSQISTIKVTGVGSTFLKNDIYGLPVEHVDEFRAIGRGALSMSGLDEAVVVSMGTGTAFVHAKGDTFEHIGGSGVGGGTLHGLAAQLLDVQSVAALEDMAEGGNLANVDLTVGDITSSHGSLPDITTAANFGHISDYATKADKAYGLFNMVFQTVGVLAAFAAKRFDLKDIVVCGTLSETRYASDLFAQVEALHGVRFIIPDNALYATVLGAALS